MEKKVIVHIQDNHRSEDDSYSSELTTTGRLDCSGADYLLRYTETDEEFQECTTTLEVRGDRQIIMTREGPYSTQMILEKNRRHSIIYETPYGAVQLGVFAKDIHSEMNGSGGKLRLRYAIDYSSGQRSMNELTLTVREA